MWLFAKLGRTFLNPKMVQLSEWPKKLFDPKANFWTNSASSNINGNATVVIRIKKNIRQNGDNKLMLRIEAVTS